MQSGSFVLRPVTASSRGYAVGAPRVERLGGDPAEWHRKRGAETTLAVDREVDRRAGPGAAKERDRAAALSKDREDLTVGRSWGVGIEFGLCRMARLQPSASLPESFDEQAPEVFGGPLHSDRGVSCLSCLSEMRHSQRLEKQRVAVVGYRHRFVEAVPVAETA